MAMRGPELTLPLASLFSIDSMNEVSHVTLIDGSPAEAGALSALAFAGFAHFTAMQVRDGRIRGLDLHLDRLTVASQRLFNGAVAEDEVRAHLRAALSETMGDCSVTITVYDSAGEFTATAPAQSLHTLIRTGPPSSGPSGPLSLALVEHERFMADIKHVGEAAKTVLLRRSVGEGFDDAAFVDRAGRITEGSIWNLAFWDGKTVVWPEAHMLIGTMMSTVRRQLDHARVPQRTQEVLAADVERFSSAVVMNSWSPGIPVSRIGTTDLDVNSRFAALLHEAHESEPAVEA